LVAVGWWPPSVDFDLADLKTVTTIFEERARDQQRARR
jgi:hypothetical protein